MVEIAPSVTMVIPFIGCNNSTIGLAYIVNDFVRQLTSRVRKLRKIIFDHQGALATLLVPTC